MLKRACIKVGLLPPRIRQWSGLSEDRRGDQGAGGLATPAISMVTTMDRQASSSSARQICARPNSVESGGGAKFFDYVKDARLSRGASFVGPSGKRKREKRKTAFRCPFGPSISANQNRMQDVRERISRRCCAG